MTTATLRPWGSSLGIVLPKEVCRALGVGAGSRFDMAVENGELRIKPTERYTIDALLADYDGPMPGEYDWGAPRGREVW